MPLRTFEAATLEEALEDAHREVGPTATLVGANRVRRGGVGGFFAKECVEVTVEVTADAPGRGLMDLVEAASDDEAAPFAGGSPAARPAATASAVPAAPATPTLSTEQASFQDLVLRLAKEATPTVTRPILPTTPDVAPVAPAPLPAPAPLAVTTAAPVPAPAVAPETTVERVALDRLGLPAGFTVDLATESPDQAVLRALQALPRAEALPTAAGSVVAVVGPRDEALALARSLADELGLDPATVVLAADDDHGSDLAPGCLLPSIEAIAEARWSARYQPRPAVVAVASPVERSTSSWVRRALEALDPSATWAVVDAGRKPEDVLDWSERIGGVDAVAVGGVDRTASPASILGTGLPVARIDGRRATPALWAAILTERLAA